MSTWTQYAYIRLILKNTYPCFIVLLFAFESLPQHCATSAGVSETVTIKLVFLVILVKE